jgi:hypothetical protein
MEKRMVPSQREKKRHHQQYFLTTQYNIKPHCKKHPILTLGKIMNNSGMIR